MEGNPLKKLKELAQKAKDKGFNPETNKVDNTIEKKEVVKYLEAREIMGIDSFYGTAEINETFGILWKQELVPEIPFSKKELERAKVLGQDLILYLNQSSDGRYLTSERMNDLWKLRSDHTPNLLFSAWHKENDILRHELPRFGWRLVSKYAEQEFTGQNYLEQTQTIVDKLRTEIFPEGLPQIYKEAVDEFENNKEQLSILMKGDVDHFRELCKELANMKISQLCRENYTEILYRLALTSQKEGSSEFNWEGTKISFIQTNSCLENGTFIILDNLDERGFQIEPYPPTLRDFNVSSYFSRGIWINTKFTT